jgi:4'-phosphopantetheinyl transferase
VPYVKCSFIDNIVWGTCRPVFPDLSQSIHIWRLQLSANDHLVNVYESLLAPHEMIQAYSYTEEKERHRFILSKSVLRLILSKYLHEPAENIQFSFGANKKPFLRSDNTNLHYNVSHAGDWILIAISGSAVGVDIELIDTDLDYSAILPVFFSPEEAKLIQNRNDFYLLWTRKEALVKATGKGIDNDMPFIPCTNGVHEVLPEKIGSDKDWVVVSFEMTDHYIGCVAYNPIIQTILFYEPDTILLPGYN